MIGGFALGLFLAATALAAPLVHAEDTSDYDPRVGRLSFVIVDGSEADKGEVRNGPNQCVLEFVRVATERKNSYRTVLFLVAYNEDTGAPYVVVPGFKAGEPYADGRGVITHRVIRPAFTKDDSVLKLYAVGDPRFNIVRSLGAVEEPLTERDKIAVAIAQKLAARDLGYAPILIW